MPSSRSQNRTRTSPAGLCARADLVEALAAGDLETARAIAELSGRIWSPPSPETEVADSRALTQSLAAGSGAAASVTVPQIDALPMSPARFWRVQTLESNLPIAPTEIIRPDVGGAPYSGWTNRPRTAPALIPLAEWRELEPRLRRVLCLFQPGRRPDLDSAVHRISRGRFIDRLPPERRRRWGPRLYLIQDRAERLVPYRSDQFAVQHALSELLPEHALQGLVLHEGQDPAARLAVSGAAGQGLPPPGSLVLVLGDLGCLAGMRSELVHAWQRFGRDLRAAGCVPVALLPAPLELCPVALTRVWDLIPWERPRPRAPEEDREKRAERLLILVSPAVRIEPGLLRAARLLLPPGAADAGTESDVWQRSELLARSPAGAGLSPEHTRRLRCLFAERLPSDLQLGFARLLRAWRAHLPEEIWFEELLNLPEPLRTHPDLAEDQALARRYFAGFAQDSEGAIERMSGADRSWFERLERRAGAAFWGDPEVGHSLQRLSWRIHQEDPDFRPPYELDPAAVETPGVSPKRLKLGQHGNLLELRVSADPEPISGQDSPLAEIWTQNGLVRVTPSWERAPGFWMTCEVPSWASDWGWDDYGAWVEFGIEGKKGQSVIQRMRWIEPGSFLMGSPEDEPERMEWEGPRHEVRIQEGFWLFDTACTQALWEAVMGENPSHFKGSDRPVEQVSWNAVQHFVESINERLPCLGLSLPSEALWEYGCRAGTVTPFSLGTNITPEQVNYDGNFPYAGGKKDLYRQETIPAKALTPNAWGLYQMHGNVDEWVQDAWHDNYIGAPTDGSAWGAGEAGANRVIRGGSWSYTARVCRSACRSRFAPDIRSDYLGFRCARVQVREPGRPEAERTELARPGPRSGSGRGGTDPSRGAGREGEWPRLLRLDIAVSASAELPDAPALEIRSDRETLLLYRCAKPSWASAMGRDRFGLWAEIRIEPSSGEPVVQRLRWIPPGRFLMGSPEDEPGRWDDEGPQHEVTIGQGFWLFDTPCTQALWVALGLKNPSRFQDPARPVEQVSWDDIQQRFLPALNERLPGFVLPAEAQWEYACRAGTQTALYTGPIEIRGERNAPALDPIAWYGGNSGVGFELEDGDDSSGWSEVQYPNPKSGSHPVGKKQPNPWGLYDMLGNVWEWTQDAWHENYQEAPTDGTAWDETATGAGRVIRGGSWSDPARGCRSAYRLRRAPDARDYDLGFRCARVQV
ncbi:Sulphatase-modifying factor protein [Thiorhodococcus drewsii AZ1]|uniref:Sulphatase-modifying factor protein n=1 Tax=Thiorhodococcus drewsii AZ1 TaxID=765913 RepID=G2E222_9GAMM|nr:formylglycine-generating enzyme family protein [Thiorhodococcus drewsii]EGV30971.1 Sulphatase-modifying factor protein [Thiorhodococcus drewsii AZ1]